MVISHSFVVFLSHNSPDCREFFQLDNPRNSSVNIDEDAQDDVAGVV